MRGVYIRDSRYIPPGFNTTKASLTKKWKHMSKTEVECWAKLYESTLTPPIGKVVVEDNLGGGIYNVRVFGFNSYYFSSFIESPLFCELWSMPVEELPKLINEPDLLIRHIVITRIRENI